MRCCASSRIRYTVTRSTAASRRKIYGATYVRLADGTSASAVSTS